MLFWLLPQRAIAGSADLGNSENQRNFEYRAKACGYPAGAHQFGKENFRRNRLHNRIAKSIDESYTKGMDSFSPYEAPPTHMSPQPPPHVPDFLVPEPGSIKVIGIMHLVIAAYGLFTTVFSVLGALVFQGMSQRMLGGSLPGGVSSGAQETAMLQYMNELKPFTYISCAFSFGLAVMLIMAGIGLLKSRESGRVLSIRYAWASVSTKVINLILAFAFIIPVTKRMTDALYQGLPGGMGNMMGLVAQYSQVFTILISFTYPVVVLVLMKGEKVRQYLAGR